MKVSDIFNFSLQNFKNRKSRLVFTVLSVSVAVGVILFLVSLGYGLQKTILERITTKESLLTLDVAPQEIKIFTLNDETITKISQIEGVDKVSPQGTLPAQVSMGDLTSETNVNLINPNFFSLAGLNVKNGKIFGDKDQQKAVVNSAVVELFNMKPEQILGKKIKFNFLVLKEIEGGGITEIETFKVEKEFEIIGVTEETETTNQVFVKRSDLPEVSIKEYQVVKVKVTSQKAMDAVREKLIEMGFLVSALSDIVSQANQIFKIIQTVLAIFGIISLIVAAIGLINILTITLLERTNEIGIMRAIGASPGDIQRLFLLESVLIGFMGGLGGIIIGLLASWFFNIGLNILARTLGGQAVTLFFTPFWFFVFIVVFSTAVGFLAGIFPARRAAKLNPLEALRYK